MGSLVYRLQPATAHLPGIFSSHKIHKRTQKREMKAAERDSHFLVFFVPLVALVLR